MYNYSEYIGKPFVQDGRGPSGYDCYGLTKAVFSDFGQDIGEYWCLVEDKEQINKLFRRAVKNRWRQIDYRHGEEIPVPALMGLRFNAPAGICNHTGVYIGDGLFIHTRERIGVCVDRIDNPYWRHQIVGIYEFVGGKT